MDHDRDPADAALAALLREHSREVPPPAVDAAILAAAHRAVASAPKATDRAPQATDRAPKTSRWRMWLPIAAAAAFTAVVIGVRPPASTEPDASAARDEAPLSKPGTASSAEPATPPAPSEPAERADARRESGSATSDASRQNAAPREKRDASGSTGAVQRADEAAGTRAAPRREVKAQEAPARPPPQSASKVTGARVESVPPPVAADPARAAPAPLAPPPVAPSAGAVSAPKAAQAARETDPDAARAAESIARMRELRSEGRLAEAAQELARFRAAFADADARLPDDLRAWARALPR
jgi:hypothetical protein